jgi:Flp pilus assembly protein TadG
MKNPCRTRGSRSGRQEDGAAAVEFALIIAPLLLVVFGLIQYGFYFYAEQAGSSAANSALRQLAVGNCQDSTKLATYVNSRISGAASGTATITTNYYDATGTAVTNTPVAQNVPIGGTVKLTIQFQAIDMHLPLVPFLSSPTINRVVQARVEDTTDEGCGV